MEDSVPTSVPPCLRTIRAAAPRRTWIKTAIPTWSSPSGRPISTRGQRPISTGEERTVSVRTGARNYPPRRQPVSRPEISMETALRTWYSSTPPTPTGPTPATSTGVIETGSSMPQDARSCPAAAASAPAPISIRTVGSTCCSRRSLTRKPVPASTGGAIEGIIPATAPWWRSRERFPPGSRTSTGTAIWTSL